MSRCGSMASRQRLVTEEFDKKSRTYSEEYSGHSSEAHSLNIRRRRVCELLDGIKGKKVLDIGCGPGIMAEGLLGRGFEFFGVDISGRMIERCIERFGRTDRAHFSVGRIEKLEFPDSFFDAVVSMGVVEYIDDDDAALKEMARVLKPGGTVIITLPNRLSPYRLWGSLVCNKAVVNLVKKLIGRKNATLNHREYTEKAYRRLLASHKLGVVDIVYYNFKLVLFPLDRLFPALTASLSRKLEFLCRSKLRWLGTGFIVKAEKI